jgi:catechol 2,3-dioxygenase-like lactoylglutathione lyase family enzyme
MKITGINHLAFITDDMTQTIRYYRDLLGMELATGIGHDGFRHYFFSAGSAMVAFFEYQGAAKMNRKPHGSPTRLPLGFDHVSFTVGSREELFAVKDKIAAAGFEVSGAVDHGTVWSIYFFDNNNIPLEVSWNIMELTETPAIVDIDPLPIAEEGSEPQAGIWPEVINPTPISQMTACGGNGLEMRESFLKDGTAKLTDEYSATMP